ncbi:hypothetical protein [Anoxynatronum sibiricum]|uniref:hypothetical protein n=1 Tax=Anoxynatronum sibiricum TaxID=210623 RepID=UPI0031B89C52
MSINSYRSLFEMHLTHCNSNWKGEDLELEVRCDNGGTHDTDGGAKIPAVIV